MDEVARRANNAKSVLENQAFLEAMEEVRKELLQGIEASEVEKRDFREASYHQLQNLTLLRTKLEQFVRAGQGKTGP